MVQYVSRAIPDVERNYSQIELHMLAADFAWRKFHVFLYGLPFKIVTDHKPLEVILYNPGHKTCLITSSRSRIGLERQIFQSNTSSHPLPRENCTKREPGTTKDVKQWVNFVIPSDIPQAIRKEELVEAKEHDEDLQKLITCTQEKTIDHRDLGMKAYSSCWLDPSKMLKTPHHYRLFSTENQWNNQITLTHWLLELFAKNAVFWHFGCF